MPLFADHQNEKLKGIMCTHIDDFLFGGAKRFIELVAWRIRTTFIAGTKKDAKFTYLGLNTWQ